MNAILKKAKQLIAEDQITAVIDLLSSHTSSELVQNQLTLLSARYQEYEKHKLEGLLEIDHYAEANKIRFALMGVIGEMKKGVVSPVQTSDASIQNSYSERRTKDLNRRIEETFDLIDAWRQKQSLAENPNEAQRCAIEISRLNELAEQYIKEFNTLT